VVYLFEKQDMANAKKVLGDTACIAGNFDTNLLSYGTKEQIVEETKRLLDICAPGGGYMMSNSISLDNAKPENLAAWYEAVEKYGRY
jgi:uroporphyrinogen-III decarboxylase